MCDGHGDSNRKIKPEAFIVPPSSPANGTPPRDGEVEGRREEEDYYGSPAYIVVGGASNAAAVGEEPEEELVCSTSAVEVAASVTISVDLHVSHEVEL